MISEVRVKNFKALRDYERRFRPDFNVIVGVNGSGKSTLLEAIGLALSGRFRGQWPQEVISPYWFNQQAVDDYFNQLIDIGSSEPWPETPAILIEVFLDVDGQEKDVARLDGKVNSKRSTERGLAFEVTLSKDYISEYQAYIVKWLNRHKEGNHEQEKLLPVEYFDLTWRTFSDYQLRRRPRGVNFALIDTKSNMYSRGIDRYTRDLLTENVPDEVGASLSVNLRSAFSDTADEALSEVNRRIKQDTAAAPEQFGVQIDPSNFIQWQNGIAPSLQGLPFSQAGEGAQAIAKVEVALLERQEKAKTILIEEPENNLSHTKLRQLLARIRHHGREQQLIVTTHSSFVLNRLGLDSLVLMGKNGVADFSQLDDEDIQFFQKLPNFDTLRLILADQVILVEGISDLLVTGGAVKREWGKSAEELGVDIISMEGTKHQRWLKLAKALNKPVIAIRDNDGQPDGHWEQVYADALGDNGKLFVGESGLGETLEPQIAEANKANMTDLMTALEQGPFDDFVEWATKNKSDAAFKLISLSEDVWNIPSYICEAVKALRIGQA